MQRLHSVDCADVIGASEYHDLLRWIVDAAKRAERGDATILGTHHPACTWLDERGQVHASMRRCWTPSQQKLFERWLEQIQVDAATTQVIVEFKRSIGL